jgi:hypothetical protein
VFRIRPESLEAQVGFGERIALLLRAGALGLYWFLALVNAIGVAAGLVYLRGGFDPVIPAAAAGILLVGMGLGHEFARRRFRRSGEIEIVFWDVAGEHVYSDSAADYYAFLSALVRERTQRVSPSRSYAFAPVLMCNPLSLGVRAQTSAYARLRELVPLFASLGGPTPRALVAINRWELVEKVCAPDSDRDEVVAVMPHARVPDDEVAADDELATARLQPTEALPVVARDVVRKHCLDAEDGTSDDVRFAYLRYDAGAQCEIVERPWSGYEELPAPAKLRWRAPTAATPARVIEYLYEEGPRSFEGTARREFLAWLADMSYRAAQPAALVAEAAEDAPATDGARAGDAAAQPGPAPAPDADAAIYRPQGRAAAETAEAMRRIWTPRRPRDDGDADPWSGEGTEPGIGATPPPAEPAKARLGARAEDDDAEALRSGGFRSSGT